MLNKKSKNQDKPSTMFLPQSSSKQICYILIIQLPWKVERNLYREQHRLSVPETANSLQIYDE